MVYVRMRDFFLVSICACAIIAFASPSFGGKGDQKSTEDGNQGRIGALKKKLEGKIGSGPSRPLPPTPKKAVQERPQFTNLEQEAKVYGTPQNLNLDTLYKVNPQLWDEFLRRFSTIPSDTPLTDIQPFFARFIQDYVLAAIYETSFPALSWYEGTEGFNWRSILLNPQYRNIIEEKRRENRSWLISDVADWIQKSYITSRERGSPLPWQLETMLSTQASHTGGGGGAPPPPPPPPEAEAEAEVQDQAQRRTSKSWATVQVPNTSPSGSSSEKTPGSLPAQPSAQVKVPSDLFEKIKTAAREKQQRLSKQSEYVGAGKPIPSTGETEEASSTNEYSGFNEKLADQVKLRLNPEKEEEEEGDEYWADESSPEESTRSEGPTQTYESGSQDDQLRQLAWVGRLNNFAPEEVTLSSTDESLLLEALEKKTAAYDRIYEDQIRAYEEELRILADIDLLNDAISKLAASDTVEDKEKLEWLITILPMMKAYFIKKNQLEVRIGEINDELNRRLGKNASLETELEQKKLAMEMLKNPSEILSIRMQQTSNRKADNLRQLAAVQGKIRVQRQTEQELAQLKLTLSTDEKDKIEVEAAIKEAEDDLENLRSEITNLLNKYLVREIESFTGKTANTSEILLQELQRRNQANEDSDTDSGDWSDSEDWEDWDD